ncbi:MAG: hypothetical protein V4805_13605 [Pseudomonadota bacterium]
MPENISPIALFDDSPFFESALRHGVSKGIVDQAKISAMENDAPKGIVQIADAFGSKYLRPEIELARKRIVNLVSLYLADTSQGDLDAAAKLIRDNTILTLSRGGSSLLKALFAMPEYAMLGRIEKGRVEDFLEYWSRKENLSDYHAALAQRQNNMLEIEAAFWFGQQLRITRANLEEQDAEADTVIRSALLIRSSGKSGITLANQVEFATLLDAIRNAGKKIGKVKSAKGKIDPVPAQYQALVARIEQQMQEHDLPLIHDQSLSLDKLVYALKDRYFIRDHEVEDTSDYDALVSKEWTKVTKGKNDTDALLTLFLCLAADVPPKTSLSEKSAKTLLKKIREHGLHPELAVEFIKTHAPHEKQEGLLEDWGNFMQDAESYLLDDWDATFHGALRFLEENCYIEKAGK